MQDKRNAILKSMCDPKNKSSFSMAELLTVFHYEGLNFAVYSIIRIHSLYV